MELEKKVALVTGGGQGIGKAIVLALAKKGASVVIADIDLESADKVADEAGKFGKAVAKKADVSSETDVKRLVKETLEEFGRIDILVNNAGIDLKLPTEEVTVEQWQRVMDINLKGAFLCAQAVGKEMIKNRSGKIINIASVAGHSPVPRMAAYNASKAGVLLLSKTLAVEWAQYNINVNSISPGVTETSLLSRLRMEDPEAIKAREKRIPLGRVAQPEDIAQVAIFLASSASDNITGEDIKSDGGMLAIHPGYV